MAGPDKACPLRAPQIKKWPKLLACSVPRSSYCLPHASAMACQCGFAAGEHIRFLPYMFSTAVAFIDNIIVHMGEQ